MPGMEDLHSIARGQKRKPHSTIFAFSSCEMYMMHLVNDTMSSTNVSNEKPAQVGNLASK